MVLVGLLVFILVMMRFAGDPKNWAWMGFGRGAVAPPAATEKVSPPPPSAELQMSPERIGEEIEKPGPRLELDELKPALDELRKDFWTRLVRRLDSPSQLALYGMFRQGSSSPDAALAKSHENLVERIELFNDQYSTELLSQSGELQVTDPARRQLWYDLLFQWQTEWKDDVAPALKYLSGLSPAAEREPDGLARLRSLLGEIAAEMVVDDSPLGRPSEIPFWNLLVERLLAEGENSHPPTQVEWVELRTQPESFRGQRIEFRGRIRGARIQKSSGDSATVPQYYELWVQADNHSTIPYCVYALEIPNGFPPLTEQLSMLDATTSIVGYFFKNRSYLTDEHKTQFCPVVLTRLPEVTIVSAAAPQSNPPTPFAVGGIAAGVALLAAWIAFRVYRSTIFIRRIASPHIASTLEELESDPQVETVRDRLARWDSQSKTDPNIRDSSRPEEY